ncbi:MAG: ABC transporter permease, partial [Lachnospiraceae bacterium]|nr:ABC transporter permease [Lachnospiraceae bacterium]
MNKRKLSNHLLSTPFYVWILAFILIPLGMVFYYGFTDKTGTFTLDNVIAMAGPEHIKALWVSLLLSV